MIIISKMITKDKNDQKRKKNYNTKNGEDDNEETKLQYQNWRR